MGKLRKTIGLAVSSAALGTAAMLALPGTAQAAQAAQATEAPCGAQAAACIDLSENQSWLMRDGAVTYGPVPITSGKPGYETPPGTFNVTFKNIDHWSKAYDAPMPYAVFFTRSGIAFHEGSLTQESHGCIHLSPEAARTYFDSLNPGDVVEVVP
jgi:lipoprotein-anchoring transpeptidase ErfK/SrfK